MRVRQYLQPGVRFAHTSSGGQDNDKSFFLGCSRSSVGLHPRGSAGLYPGQRFGLEWRAVIPNLLRSLPWKDRERGWSSGQGSQSRARGLDQAQRNEQRHVSIRDGDEDHRPGAQRKRSWNARHAGLGRRVQDDRGKPWRREQDDARARPLPLVAAAEVGGALFHSSLNPDKKPEKEVSPAEISFAGPRKRMNQGPDGP